MFQNVRRGRKEGEAMKRSEQELLKARLNAANRDHQADAYDRRVEHNPTRYDTEGQARPATIQQTDARPGFVD